MAALPAPVSEPPEGTFAYLIPLSLDACSSMSLSHNSRFLVCAPKSYAFLPPRHRSIAQLELCHIYGSRHFSVGKSRSNDFLLPSVDDVGEHQFVLHFEPCTGILLISDLSADGTRLRHNVTEDDCLHLSGQTCPLTRSCQISFGRSGRYRYFLWIVRQPKDDRIELHRRYLRSIGTEPSVASAHLEPPRAPARIVFFDKYLHLADFGVTQREGIGSAFACLRSTDGRVVAVKRMRDGHAALLAAPRHQNVVSCIDELVIDGTAFVVMEFVPFGSLAALLTSPRPDTADLVFLRSLMRQCLEAVKHLQEHRIPHGPITAEHVLVWRHDPLWIKVPGLPSPSLQASDDDTLDVAHLALQALGVRLLDPRLSKPDLQHLPCAPLLDGMLKTDPSERSTVTQCLLDPWLNGHGGSKRTIEGAAGPPNKKRKIILPAAASAHPPTDTRADPWHRTFGRLLARLAAWVRFW